MCPESPDIVWRSGDTWNSVSEFSLASHCCCELQYLQQTIIAKRLNFAQILQQENDYQTVKSYIITPTIPYPVNSERFSFFWDYGGTMQPFIELHIEHFNSKPQHKTDHKTFI